MNEFLAPPLLEHVERLVLGIEPQDALRGRRIAQAIEIALDGVPHPLSRPVRQAFSRVCERGLARGASEISIARRPGTIIVSPIAGDRRFTHP